MMWGACCTAGVLCGLVLAGPAKAEDGAEAPGLSREQVLEMVAGVFGDRYADRIEQAEVVQDGGQVIVTIPPRPEEVPEGHLRYGPSYSARIVLEAESGKLVEARIGR